jgi:hypothetical protein
MFINKSVLTVGIAAVAALQPAFAQQALPNPGNVSPIQVIENPYPAPSKLALPTGEVIEMTIGTLADMQKKAEIRQFETQVENIFFPKTDPSMGGMRNGFMGIPPNALPRGVAMQVPEAPQVEDAPVEQLVTKSIEVLSVYGKKNALRAEVSSESGLKNVASGDTLFGPFRVVEVNPKGVAIEYLGKGVRFVGIGQSISYTEKQ